MPSHSEISRYHADGYVMLADLRLPLDEVDHLRTALEDVVIRDPRVPLDRMVNTHLHGTAPYGIAGSELVSFPRPSLR